NELDRGLASLSTAVATALAIAIGVNLGSEISHDPACVGLDLVPPRGREASVATVLSLAFGLGGGVSALLLGAAGGDDDV
ncbi:hypothetical protein ACWCO9_39710, partial [Streptomyces sp. NPDC001937]